MRLGDRQYQAMPGPLVTIPARTRHHVQSTGRQPLFLLTVYTPPAS